MAGVRCAHLACRQVQQQEQGIDQEEDWEEDGAGGGLKRAKLVGGIGKQSPVSTTDAKDMVVFIFIPLRSPCSWHPTSAA